MKIDLTALTAPQLAVLIVEAGALLAERLGGGATAIASVSMPPKPRAPELDAPADDDKDFVLYVKSLVQRGQYIKADERTRVAEIALNHPAWVRRQGLPADGGTGSWRKAGQYMGGARAKER